MKRSCQRQTQVLDLPAAHDLVGAEPVPAQQDDFGLPDLILRRIAIPHDRLQREAIGRHNSGGNTRSDAPDSHAIRSVGIL
jgi:hypothetical protein